VYITEKSPSNWPPAKFILSRGILDFGFDGLRFVFQRNPA